MISPVRPKTAFVPAPKYAPAIGPRRPMAHEEGLYGEAVGLVRPSLVAVIAAISDWPADSLSLYWHQVCGAEVYANMTGVGKLKWSSPNDGRYRWTVGGVDEAFAVLGDAQLLPPNDARRSFGHDANRPLSLPDFAAWSTLGTRGIHFAEEQARELVVRMKDYGCPQTQNVVWRVGQQEAKTIWRNASSGVSVNTSGFLSHTQDGRPKTTILKGAQWIWDIGLSIDAIDSDCITLVVPAFLAEPKS